MKEIALFDIYTGAPIPAGKTIDELEGTIVKVRIDESLTWYLSGEVVDAE